MSLKLVFLCAVLLILPTFSFPQQDEGKIEGKWTLNFAKSGGKFGLDLAPSFQTIEIRAREITMNGERRLKFRTDEKTDPIKIYVTKEEGGETIRVYSGIYRFFKGDLVICVNSGDTAPKEFSAGEFNSNFLLRFSRTGP